MSAAVRSVPLVDRMTKDEARREAATRTISMAIDARAGILLGK
jgi:hypothetical protein